MVLNGMHDKRSPANPAAAGVPERRRPWRAAPACARQAAWACGPARQAEPPNQPGCLPRVVCEAGLQPSRRGAIIAVAAASRCSVLLAHGRRLHPPFHPGFW